MWSVLQRDWFSPLNTSQVDIDPVSNNNKKNTICNWNVLFYLEGKFSKLLTALHGSVSLCFCFFPPIQHAGCSFLGSVKSRHLRGFNLLVWNGRCLEQTSRYLTNSSTYGQPIRFPLLLYPLPAYPTWFLLCHRGLVYIGEFGFFCFVFCIKVKSTIFGIVTRNQGTM